MTIGSISTTSSPSKFLPTTLSVPNELISLLLEFLPIIDAMAYLEVDSTRKHPYRNFASTLGWTPEMGKTPECYARGFLGAFPPDRRRFLEATLHQQSSKTKLMMAIQSWGRDINLEQIDYLTHFTLLVVTASKTARVSQQVIKILGSLYSLNKEHQFPYASTFLLKPNSEGKHLILKPYQNSKDGMYTCGTITASEKSVKIVIVVCPYKKKILKVPLCSFLEFIFNSPYAKNSEKGMSEEGKIQVLRGSPTTCQLGDDQYAVGSLCSQPIPIFFA